MKNITVHFNPLLHSSSILSTDEVSDQTRKITKAETAPGVLSWVLVSDLGSGVAVLTDPTFSHLRASAGHVPWLVIHEPCLCSRGDTVSGQPLCFADSLGLTLGRADPCADSRK